MKDYYNFEEYEEIQRTQLISNFNNNKTLKLGALAIYNGSLGKPGDRIFELESIKSLSNELEFKFGTDIIRIFEPHGIIINEKVICVKKSSHIIWYGKNKIFGETTPRTDINSNNLKDMLYGYNEEKEAFVFYGW
jgi:hypothetical protein